MSARTKLNAAYVLGSVVIAALVGVLFQSRTVFVLAVTVMIALCLINGTIRPQGRRR